MKIDNTLKMEDELDAFEKERNSRGPDRLFVGPSHPFYKFAEELYENGKEGTYIQFVHVVNFDVLTVRFQ